MPAKKECNYCTQGSSRLVRDTTATGTSCSLLRSLALERRRARGLSLVVVWTPCSLFGCVAARAFSGPAAHVPRAAPRAYGTGRGSADARVGTATAGARACARSLSLFLSSLAFLPRAPPVTTPSRAAVPRAGRGGREVAVTVAAPCPRAPRRTAPPYAYRRGGPATRAIPGPRS